jgi:diguanylate cyclase (GGDEF)-like protein
MLMSTILLTIADSGGWLINGNTDNNSIVLNYIFNSFLYLFDPLPVIFWVAYVMSQANYRQKVIKKTLHMISIPYFILVIGLLINPMLKMLFYIDGQGYYHRGPFYIYLYSLCYFYILTAYFFIIKNRKKLDKRTFNALMIFALPPAVGGLAQTCFFGLMLMSPGITLSLIIIYINIQNRRIYTDYLTGVFNRREADGFVRRKINGMPYESFSAILFDIDRFKEINDRLGHVTGDDALESVAKIITGALRSEDFVARYGGDEFLAILNIGDINQLKKTVARILSEAEAFNQLSQKPYVVSLSMGYDVYDRLSGLNEEQFIKRIDKLMYADKNNKQIFSVIK